MFLLLATLFVSAPSDATPGQRHERDTDSRVERAAEVSPKSVWRVGVDGTAIHLQTALTCPASIGGFERTLLRTDDASGLDVGCRFDKGIDARITIFLTKRTGQTLADDFDAARAALTAHNDDAKIIGVPVPMPSTTTGFVSALYALHSGALTRLWAADLSGWTLKYRATYHVGVRTDVLEAISKLTQQIEATAGAHLATCAVAHAVERDGVRVTDGVLITRLSLIGGLSAQAEEDQAAKSRQEIWCVEEAIRDPQTPLLYWRNVLPSRPNDDTLDDSIPSISPGGPVDRFTLMTVEDPPTWIIDADTGANMLIDKAGNGAPIIHALIRRESYLTSTFAFFRGRPSLATLTPLMRNIVLGKARPVATGNSKTGVVSIPRKTPAD